jgi:alanine racemase
MSPAQLDALLAFRPPRPVDVHLKMNSGMNRLGLADPPDYADAVRHACVSWPGLGRLTLMTHFATADEPAGIAWQMERFEAADRRHRRAAAFTWPTRRPWSAPPGRARPTGSGPASCSTAWRRVSRPRPATSNCDQAMTLTSRIIGVQRLAPGDRLGYGAASAA